MSQSPLRTASLGSVDLPRIFLRTHLQVRYHRHEAHSIVSSLSMLRAQTSICPSTCSSTFRSFFAATYTPKCIPLPRITHQHITSVSAPTLMFRRRKDLEFFEAAMRGAFPKKHSSKRRSSSKTSKELPVANPSASILLISPANHILLLHRVSSSSTFASAHVFPGGHCSPQDGNLPPPTDPSHHEDSLPYRHAAIRECFEESGILLARKRDHPEELVELAEQERDEGRRAVHAEKVPFTGWVKQKGGQLDTEGLVPFTRWLTPANIPKRYSTQMYLYLLPLESGPGLGNQTMEQMHIPTPDGGVEHTAAKFAWAGEWIHSALKGQCVLFPPQFFLLSLVAEFLKPPRMESGKEAKLDTQQLAEQRERLLEFVKGGDPPWGEKCISPNPIRKSGDTLWMGMGDAGPELEGTGRSGDKERVLRVELSDEVERGRRRPRPTELVMKKDLALKGERRGNFWRM